MSWDGTGLIHDSTKKFLHRAQTGYGAHPVSYPMSTGGSVSGGKADHSPPSSAEVKKGGAIPPLPHVFMA
jgi:hypothetical protein